ncbi:hypothetical protein OIDMADRAFT_182285 [Oidiodendron maius Zn]|uniref:Uncharacterized protein n=1 Tax=Oidiodendron maius (strain Zn) TaxID=913774 RepID=A0A0C3CG16_OIDMZ|nr:hypothetical protein OIDMADRAFT_182285 [Oidiodendron maius Zn]
MSSPSGTPQQPSMAVEGPSLLPSSESSDAALETQSDENLQPSAVPVNAVIEAVHDDPPDDIVDGSLVGDRDLSNASTKDIPLLDWIEFESEYKKALTEANEVEDKLVLEFEKLSKTFVFWAEASAQHDNDRAWKRLKTRERYVQLSEQKLEEKKKHYIEVVQAFQNALKLLGA